MIKMKFREFIFLEVAVAMWIACWKKDAKMHLDSGKRMRTFGPGSWSARKCEYCWPCDINTYLKPIKLT